MTTQDSRLFSGASPAVVQQDLLPLVGFRDEGMSLEAVEQLVEDKLVPHLMRYGHAGFQSMFNRVPEVGAAMGARVALDHNQGVTNWQVSPGGAALEELCCESLCRLFQMGEKADATFMYSGTYANQQALYMALHRKAEVEGFNFGEEGIPGFRDPSKLAILASRDAHFSLRQSVRMLGLGEQCLIPLEVDADRRIDPDQLQRLMAELGGIKDVFCVVATAGTTSTGAIDPIEVLVEAAHQRGSWLHVDGAYGFSFSLLPECRARFRGVERADSITWDPHKQLGIPIPNSLLFVKDKQDFSRMTLFSHYFNRESSTEPNPGIKSPPSTRPMSALPLATSLLHRGLDLVRDELRAPLAHVRRLKEHLAAQDDFECRHAPDTGILCFQYQPEHVPESRRNELQTFIYDAVLGDGRRSISVTQLGDVVMLRILVMSASVRYEDLLETIEVIRSLGLQFDGESQPR
ncbi:MAG: aspartate aminotransferase family protein [Actinomycetia bacterium]|nr:aspartate aminotransferase family protein [Actinomycetes bacterium]